MDNQELPQLYYMVVDEKSTGPYSFEEVLSHPALAPHTLMWKPGLDNWVSAQTLPEFEEVFIKKTEPERPVPPQYNNNSERDFNYNDSHHNPGGAYQNPQQEYHHPNPFANNPQYRRDHQYGPNYHHQRYDGYRQNGYRPPFRTNWLPWAIVATIVGFFTSCIGAIFGIIGIVQANRANTLYAQGFEAEANAANSNARIMTIIGLIFAGIGILIWFWFGSFFSAFSSYY